MFCSTVLVEEEVCFPPHALQKGLCFVQKSFLVIFLARYRDVLRRVIEVGSFHGIKYKVLKI